MIQRHKLTIHTNCSSDPVICLLYRRDQLQPCPALHTRTALAALHVSATPLNTPPRTVVPTPPPPPSPCRHLPHAVISPSGVFHRDIKPENILVDKDWNVVKLADFGSCRGIYSKQPYTEYISTRWYRAPECLLTNGYYDYKMDVWGIGCVMFEIMALFPLFPGTNEVDQVDRIHTILGTPNQALLGRYKRYAGGGGGTGSPPINLSFRQKHGTGIETMIPKAYSFECGDVVIKLLSYDSEERLSARRALRHPYFKSIRDKEKATLQQHKADRQTHADGRGGRGKRLVMGHGDEEM